MIAVCVEKMAVVGDVPLAAVPVYDTPFNCNAAIIVLLVNWNKVKGDPAGVQAEPGAALEQPATVPTPGAM